MDRKTLSGHLGRLLSIRPNSKAREIAAILTDEFGQHIDRSAVNSVLYEMKARGQAKVSADHRWSAVGSVAGPQPQVPDFAFTDEQQAVVNIDASGHILVRGQAGSGKTTVLAARAGRILSAMNYGSLLFVTYNAALCAYVKNTFRKAGMDGNIEVCTFHDWARNAAEQISGEKRRWVDSRERAEILCRLIKEAAQESGEHRLYQIDTDDRLLPWWGEEIAWLYGQNIATLGAYQEAERVGRGTALRVSKEDRTAVWRVFEAWCEWLEENEAEDYDNPGGLVLDAISRAGGSLPDNLRRDHVMVDEVQDFDRSWLIALAQVPRVSMSLAGDLAQKIYKRSFTWSSVGIEVRGGRSRRLSSSHRTTREIMEVAKLLINSSMITSDPDWTPPILPTKSGPPVRRILGRNPKEAYDLGYDFVSKNFKRLRAKSVAVAVPFSRQTYPAAKALEARDVRAKAARGHTLGSSSSGVVVTTYHQLKGLEFDHVVLLGLHDAQFPGRYLANVPEEDVDEEQQILARLIYVAMTRAKESVTLVGSEPFCRFFVAAPKHLFSSEMTL